MEESVAKVKDFFSAQGLLPDYASVIIGIILTFIISIIVIKIGNKFIERFMKENRENNYIEEKKVKTLKLLLKSILKYVVYFFAAMIILSFLNVPIGSLIAGAGVLGVAIGFGAQNLVKDIINGFFILFESQFSVDDYIETAGVSGIVEEIGFRTTKIRDLEGQLHIIPNSKITQVTNYSAGNMRVMVDIGISYNENIEEAIKVLQDMCEDIAEEKGDLITDGPQVLGVQELASSSVVIRIWAMTKPLQNWGISRYIRMCAKQVLDEAEIEIPYPHMVLVDQNKQGVTDNEQEER